MHRPYVIACLAASLVVYGAFMVPWVSIMLLAVLLLPVTLGSVKSRWAVGLYIPAVLLVQLFKFEDAPDPLLWISFAGFWVGMAALLRWLGRGAPLLHNNVHPLRSKLFLWSHGRCRIFRNLYGFSLLISR